MAQNRRMEILRVVVEDYIRTQEPISSSSVTSRHKIGVSPATVRHEMAQLEEEGYLMQPHTSAGRIPSEKGYRYFVDQLSSLIPLSAVQRHAIQDFLQGSVSMDDALHRSARLLAQITGQIAVVATPSVLRSRLKHCELVAMGPRMLLVILITDTGRVEQRTFPLPPEWDGLSQDAFHPLSSTINRFCSGLPMNRLGEKLRTLAREESVQEGGPGRLSALTSALSALPVAGPAQQTIPWKRRMDLVSSLVTTLAACFDSVASPQDSYDLYATGAARMAHRQQAPGEGIASLLDALEEQVVIMHLMDNLAHTAVVQHRPVGVAIGSETRTPSLLNAAVVTSGYGSMDEGRTQTGEEDQGEVAPAADDSLAFVGSIGPTHMDYRTTMAAVQAVAQYLTDFVRSQGDGPDLEAGGADRAFMAE